MGTYLKYARHRSFSPKPLSERQFDAPRQKLADARFETIKKKGRCPFRRLASPISPIPKTIKDSVGFSESFVFYSTRKRREATFAVIKKRQSQNKFKNVARGVAALTRRVKLPFRQRLWAWDAMACGGLGKNLHSVGIGAICVANRRKGQRPFNGRRTLRPQAQKNNRTGSYPTPIIWVWVFSWASLRRAWGYNLFRKIQNSVEWFIKRTCANS